MKFELVSLQELHDILMKKLFYSLSLLISVVGFGQVPAYYSSIDFSLTGSALKSELSDLITSTHTSPTTYSEVWDVLKTADLDPTNSSVVLLMYGYDDDDGSVINDRTRDKNANGGDVGEWNREHVFPKSLGSPNLGTSGPGSDPHNLRASDVQANGNRSNRKFASGGGDAGTAGSNWYPGDEWVGDAARIVMYMYVRYGNRCLPNAVTVGSTNAVDGNMIDLLLDWNALDPVSELETNRNNTIFAAIGNRNPFIDNPHIANRIWGGSEAVDTWGNLSVDAIAEEITFNVYPNPVTADFLYVSNVSNQAISTIVLTDLQGRTIITVQPTFDASNYELDLGALPNGTYVLNLVFAEAVETRKIVVQ